MTYCTAAGILDAVMLESVDNSSAQRVKALAWLNQTIRDVLNQPRTWRFLDAVTTLPIVANTAALPSGAGEITYIIVGDRYFDKDDQLPDDVALEGETDGYTLSSSGVITFYPTTAEASCSVKYEAGLETKYTDTTDPTIFPIEFENLLLSGTLMRLFKTEKDGRFSAETVLFDYQMRAMKARDNLLKPVIPMTPQGYVRTQRNGSRVAP